MLCEDDGCLHALDKNLICFFSFHKQTDRKKKKLEEEKNKGIHDKFFTSTETDYLTSYDLQRNAEPTGDCLPNLNWEQYLNCICECWILT